MSTDTVALIGSGLGGVLTLGIAMFAGFAWVIRRMDAMEHRLVGRMGRGDQRLETRLDDLEHELAEVKIAVARMEGPRPRLIIER